MSTLKLDTIASRDGTESTDVTNVINGSAKAWVNFNGTGTVAIRESFNVSSITDLGTGKYTVNFTTAMPDANYSVCGTNVGNTIAYYVLAVTSNQVSLSTSNFQIQLRNVSNGGVYDSDVVHAVVFR